MIIRDFTWADYEAVAALWLAVFGKARAEDAPERLAVTVTRNPGLFIVADDGGQIVGTVLGTFDGRRGYLYHVAVAATHHRQGIGTALIRDIETRLQALGASKIYFRVFHDNARALAFYRRLGYDTNNHVLHLGRALDET